MLFQTEQAQKVSGTTHFFKKRGEFTYSVFSWNLHISEIKGRSHAPTPPPERGAGIPE